MDRANRNYISLFVNRRWVQSRALNVAVEQAYHGFLKERRGFERRHVGSPQGCQPVCGNAGGPGRHPPETRLDLEERKQRPASCGHGQIVRRGQCVIEFAAVANSKHEPGEALLQRRSKLRRGRDQPGHVASGAGACGGRCGF